MVLETDVTIIAKGDPVTVLFSLNRAIQASANRGSMYIAKAVAEKARGFAPKGETGQLKDSIIAKPMENKNWGVTVEAKNTKGIPYGAFVEYGTRKSPAQPFLRPAIDAVAGYSLMAKAIWEDHQLHAAMSTPVITHRRLGTSSPLWKRAGVSGGRDQWTLGSSQLGRIQSGTATGQLSGTQSNLLTGNFGFSLTSVTLNKV